MRVKLAWVPVVPVAAWTVVRVLGLERGYPLVPLLAFTPFVAVLAVVLAVVAALLRIRAAGAVAALCAIALLAVVAPRALGGPSAPAGPPGARLRILTVNVKRGGADVASVAALARRSDVLSLQEIDARFVSDVRRAHTGMRFSVVRLRGRWDGTALFARFPLRARPVPGGTRNAEAVADATVGGTPVELRAVHTPAPVRDLQVSELGAELGHLPTARGPRLRILAGDFNATLDFHPLRQLIGRGYRDAADAVGAGLVPTWPADHRLPARVTIDHVLADHRIGIRALTVRTVPRTDHRAVLATLVLPRG